MEDGVKEDPAKPKEVKVTGKAGWLKKSSGKILGSYKDRYIHLDRTEMAVYDSEDLKNCVERIDLENFDKCHELRSPFKKKNRLILTRTSKSGSKVCDVKLQAQNQEEKEAWIKALNDGINRAKNKIFDEVKVDESLSLEHVTRTRPKGNRGRRPPTRIHMKEASNTSPDGTMRLDLDEADSMPNGTHKVSAEESEQNDTAKPQVTPAKSFDDIQEVAEEKEPAPQKKAIKPPMPPSKEKKPNEKEESEAPQKNAIIPPMPPSKDKKPSQNIEDEEPGEVMQEKKVLKPPMPPSKENKPSISDNGDATKENTSDSRVEPEATPTLSELSPAPKDTDEAEPGESASTKTTALAPTPPSKDKKPSQAPILKDKESSSEDDSDGQDDQNDQKGKDDEVDTSVQSQKADGEEEAGIEEDTVKTEEPVFTLSNNIPKPQGVMWDSPSTASNEDSAEQDAKTSTNVDTTQIVSKPLTPEPAKPANSTPHSTPEPVKKLPPAPPKKKPVKPPVKVEDSGVQSGAAVSTSVSFPITVTSSSEGVGESEMKPDLQEPKGERKVVILSLSNQGATEESEDVSGAEAEEKSVDSGQISAEDSEIGDQVTSFTDKLQGSLQGLDGETSEDDLESSDSKVPSRGDPSPAILTITSIPTVESSTTSQAPKSASSWSSKTRSASTGDLLDVHVEAQECAMKDLQQKVSLEMKETGKLLGEIGQSSDEENDPEILLATAMEMLKTADQFLKEAKSFKEVENKSKRTSW